MTAPSSLPVHPAFPYKPPAVRPVSGPRVSSPRVSPRHSLLTPLAATHPKNVPVSPFPATHPESLNLASSPGKRPHVLFLSPLFAADPNFASLNPLITALTKTLDLKSFRCRTYEERARGTPGFSSLCGLCASVANLIFSSSLPHYFLQGEPHAPLTNSAVAIAFTHGPRQSSQSLRRQRILPL